MRHMRPWRPCDTREVWSRSWATPQGPGQSTSRDQHTSPSTSAACGRPARFVASGSRGLVGHGITVSLKALSLALSPLAAKPPLASITHGAHAPQRDACRSRHPPAQRRAEALRCACTIPPAPHGHDRLSNLRLATMPRAAGPAAACGAHTGTGARCNRGTSMAVQAAGIVQPQPARWLRSWSAPCDQPPIAGMSAAGDAEVWLYHQR